MNSIIRFNIKCVIGVFFTLIAVAQPAFLAAQETDRNKKPNTVRSMGLSSFTNWYWGPMFVVAQPGSDSYLGGQLYAGFTRNLFSPVFGVGLGAEAYAEAVNEQDFDGGVRAFAALKPFYLQAGVDYLIDRNSTDFILSLALPLRRGGLFGGGSEFRFDWLPGREHTLNFGFTFYLGPRSRGKARPKHDRYHLPKASTKQKSNQLEHPHPELGQALDRLAHAAEWMNRYTTPFFDQKDFSDDKHGDGFIQEIASLKDRLGSKDMLYPNGHTAAAEIQMYHQMLERAFSLALGGDSHGPEQQEAGRRIADQARRIMFDDVIVPYNQLLGRAKKNDSLLGYGDTARSNFRQWLNSFSQCSESQSVAVTFVFDRWLHILENARDESRSNWKDSELVWLPLQYGLRPEQYATRDSLNHVLERVLDEPFTKGNDVYYVIDERFQPEVARMIHEAEDYHVLWIHDYRGKNAAGDPDRVSFRQALNYIQALTNAVQKYDDRGRMPLYIIAIDQYFYALMGGKYWLALLQNPLEHKVKLPKEYQAWAEKLDAAQETLRNAVAASQRLQAEAGKFGHDWIKKTVKVHVNVTNPSDYSFRSPYVIRSMPYFPDELMRDHRKIVFYDVSEDDPGKGEAMFSGVGIGEQYVGPTWDDRSLLIRGPALLKLKYEFLELLKQQGFKDDEIPAPLRKKQKPANYAALVEELQKQNRIVSAMNVHNQTGFRPKFVNVMKATLYNLMPPRSTVLVPDGIWNAPFWGSMLAGAALRGCRVLVIGTSPEHGAFFSMSRSHDVFARLIYFHNELSEEIETAGGMLKIGIYNRQSPLGDPVGLYEEITAGLEANPFLQELFPFPPEAYTAFKKLYEEAKTQGFTPIYYAEDAKPRKPKLHLKVNYFLSEEVRHLLSLPGWDKILRQYWQYHEKFVLKDDDLTNNDYVDVKNITDEFRQLVDSALLAFWVGLSPQERERTMAYLTVGSHNHNYRSMIGDGEAACLVEGLGSIVALLDMFTLTGLSVWVDNLESLEPFLPEYSGWKRWFGRYARKVI